MSNVVGWIDETLYPLHKANWDDKLFRETILKYLHHDSIILDLGAGAGIIPKMDFRGHAAKICGVDLDPRVVDNPMVDEGRVANANKIPYEDGCFDVVFSNNVLEHVEEPLQVFCEVARVLKPGGVFLFKTPNKWHYIPVIAQCTPHRFHQYVNRLRGRMEEDTFPTLYRANTCGELKKIVAATTMQVDRLDLIEGRPEYLRMTWLTYLFGVAYERLVNLHDIFAPFRVLLVGTLRKSE